MYVILFNLFPGFDRDILHRLSIILKVISSSYTVHIANFKEYCLQTAREIVREYYWYQIPTAVHIILMHGADIINNSVIAIGKLSEEAIERGHKVIRKYREHHARGFSRLKTNEDIFNRLLVNSDPYISYLRSQELRPKKIFEIPEDMVDLIIIPETQMETSENEQNGFIDDEELMDMYDDSDPIPDLISDSDSELELESDFEYLEDFF